MMNLSELEIPGPTDIALTEPFWTAAAAGKLIIQHCSACDRYVFYPRPMCPYCWSDALSWCGATGNGRLKSFSQIWKPGHQGWMPAAPYFVGLVELEEGPTMLSHILTDKVEVAVGAALCFTPTQIGDQVLPWFKTI